MFTIKPILAGLLVGAFLTGCDVASRPGTVTSPGLDSHGRAAQRVARSVVEFAYVTNQTDGTVSAYSIDSGSGALTEVAGSPLRAGPVPFGIAIAPKSKFVYVTNYGGEIGNGSTVYGYAIDTATGSLTPVAGSPFPTGRGSKGVAVDPTGRFAFIANFGDDTVSGYTIDANSGTLTQMPSSPFQAGGGPYGIAIDPKGRFAYATDFVGGVSAYIINEKSGALTRLAGSPFSAPQGTSGAAVDPTGTFVYAANQSSVSSDVSAFAYGAKSGELTPVPGSPFASCNAPVSIAINATGKFAYVPNQGCGNVLGYTLDPSSGALTAMAAPFSAGKDPVGIALDPQNRFALVTNNTKGRLGNISVYSIDAGSGALTQVPGSPFAAGKGPFGIATCEVKGSMCLPPVL